MPNLKTGDEIWAWMIRYPDGPTAGQPPRLNRNSLVAKMELLSSELATFGSVGLVASKLGSIGIAPLLGRDEKTIRKVEHIARRHGMAHKQEVFLRKYVKAEDFDVSKGTSR